ncbi:hypothetical protein IC235_20385 [Hymenobacter sp. BT664]|uniref:Uncharacterized protein n=1 Tax=Hymenobacter montanus TaxID=2771359 RepID=A0A927BGX9_9BACT|nr:hypothetical protein [Hymenobacter montanus]MBD2770251.1 hypothetical protein [Hymenobacter montanus]
MKAIIVWTLVSGFLFAAFLALLIAGLIKQSKRAIIFSGFALFLFACSAVWTGYTFASKSYCKISDVLKPRTGQEIYSALFGDPQHDCVKVINQQDQDVPIIDYAIWLEFETCPEELQRILSLHHFTSKKAATQGWNTQGPFTDANWFKPEALGDTVLVFEYLKANGNGQTIYAGLDSTKAYCIDVRD